MRHARRLAPRHATAPRLLPLLLLSLAACAAPPPRPAPAADTAPCRGTPSHGFVGATPHPMYVEDWPACDGGDGGGRPRVVLVHGCCHSSLYWSETPDRREGFAPRLRRAGFPVTLVELPGHGRAAPAEDFGRTGLEPARAALAALLARDGRVVLVGHSMGAQVVLRALAGLDATRRARVAAVLLLAPVRPPELITREEQPLPPSGLIRFAPELARQLFASTPTFPAEAFDAYYASLVPESAVATREFSTPGAAPPVGGAVLEGIPALMVHGELDFIPAERFEETARFLGIERVRLGADWGFDDHGHMFMVERGNEAIAARLARWIEDRARE